MPGDPYDFGAAFKTPTTSPQPPQGGGFDFGAAFQQPAQDLSTGTKRQAFNQQSLIDTRDKLKSITPANEGHKRRLDKLVNSIEMQLVGKAQNRSGLENFIRGTAAGANQGLQFPVELAGNIGAILGHTDLQKYIEENRALIQEDLDPQGKAGTAGELFGSVIGTAPGAGAAASGTGKLAVRLLPSSKIARAIAAAAEGTIGQRIGANIITGLPVNTIQAMGGVEQDVPEGASEEEAARIRSMNTANKIKNLAIGIGADALFGAIPSHGKKKIGDAPLSKEVPVVSEPLTPERQAQLDQVSAKNLVKVTAKRRVRLDKSMAQSEWQILNADMEWKELDGKAQRKIYDDFVDRRRNSNPNTSVDGNPPEMQGQLVSMDEQLKAARGERDAAIRDSEMDADLGIGNKRALMKASMKADADPNIAYLITDVNGLKDINDGLGYEAGTQLLKDARDVLLAAHAAEGVHPGEHGGPRIMRYGGDEFVTLGHPDQLARIRDYAEKHSVKQYGDRTGSLSGTIHSTLAEVESVAGKAELFSRKIEAKARQNIPGRSSEEQTIIDAARERINTAPPPIEAPVGADPAAPFPPEVMEAISHVHDAGGLQTEESQLAFAQDVKKLYDVEMSPKDRGSALQAIVEEHTPIEVDNLDGAETPSGMLTPAIKMPDGTIHPGDNHGAARWNAGIRDNPPNIVDGFVTRDKRFLSREDALKYAKDNGVPLVPKDVGDNPNILLAEDLRDPSKDVDGDGNLINPPVGEKATMLESIEHKKPLEKMSEKELGRVDDKLTDALDAATPGTPEHALVERDFMAVRDEYKSRNTKQPDVIPDVVAPDHALPPLVAGGEKANDLANVRRVPAEVARIRNLALRKASDADLNAYIDVHTQLRSEATDADIALTAQTKLDRALSERAIRAKANDALIAQVPKSGLEGTAGFAMGFFLDPNAEDTADRTTNGLMWAGVAVVGGLAVMRMKAKSGTIHERVPSDSWAGSEVADKKIVSYTDVEEKPANWRERAREWYQGIVRRTAALDRAVNTLTGNKAGSDALAAHKNPAKLASMFGRWVSMAEGALMDQPVYLDYQGNVVNLPSKSYREIIESVAGDIKGLGKLMTARTSIEGADLRSVPLDAVTANLVFHAAPESYHAAADAMRQFDLSMSMVLEKAGVLTPGSGDRFALEDFYAGLKKVFDPEGGPSKIVRDAKSKKLVVSQNPIKGRKSGTVAQVFNPAETTASMVPQIYRAAELNEIKGRLVDLWESSGKPDHLLKQVERRIQPISVDQQLRIDALKQEIKGLSQADAEGLVAAFDPKSLDPRSNVMTVYREGVLRAYRVDEDIAQAMTSLQPDELEGMWKVLGLPASIAKQGVVLNPYFVAKQAFIDGWQATLNSSYGFRPGVDQFIGWQAIIRHTPEYKQFIAAGGGHSTLQSHDYANVKTALEAVKHGGGGPLETAVKQAKELKLVDAWRTLIVPFAESARVGEYLRARNHGAPVLDALYAAKHVTANFQQRGSFTTMRGLDRASMFLNPALQGLDQALFRAGANPFRVPAEGRKAAATKYLAKAFVGITLPSMYFWFQNKDDQEINDLRKTPTGAKFWYTRSPVDQPKIGLRKGDIVKIPKPIVDGQIFGTSMESYLDKAYGNDPAQLSAAAESITRDLGFNVLPTAGVLYYGLQTNKNLGTGGNIIPQGDENLALSHQGEDKASWVSRVVSQKLTPLISPNAPEILKNATTPAGLDYIVNSVGGMLGQDAVLAISQAVESETKGFPPAKEELPIIGKVFAAYPSMNVMPIRRFYDRASQVQTVGATIAHLAKEDPTQLLGYMANNQKDYILVGLFDKARQDIANYRRAYQDVKDMPGSVVSATDRRAYMKQYQTLMIETARQANTFAIEVDKIQAAKKK